MRKLVAAATLLLLLGGGAYWYVWSATPPVTSIEATTGNIQLQPQDAKDRVLIDSVILPVDGYAVIRGIVGNHLSQIIEISPFLEKGEHKNILITYGDENPDKEDLIAMLYVDNGDKSFSGNTRPYKDESGQMIAVYVKTGLPVPTSITEPTVMMDKTMGMTMATVHYTIKGFDPKTITVPVGTMVEFVNETDGDMWVASNPHPQHDILPTFDEFEGVPKGGSYIYTFDKKGTWPYHDHLNAATEGSIKVE